MTDAANPTLPSAAVASTWTLYEPGEVLAELRNVHVRLASWDAGTSPAQQALKRYVAELAQQLQPQLEGRNEPLFFQMEIDVRRPERLSKGYDLENYLYPAIKQLGAGRFVLAVATKCATIASNDEPVTATIRVGIARRCADALDASLQHFSTAMPAGYERKEWKQELSTMIRDKAITTLPDGPVELQLAWRIAPRRNWANLWKPTGDSLGPILGAANPARPFSPNDDRIVNLRLHRNDDPERGYELVVGAWWQHA